MSLETDLRTYLLSQAAITALVKGNRIYCGVRDQDDPLPAITLARVTGEHGHTLTAAAGWCRARVQFDALATNYVDAETIGEALRGELQILGGATIGSTSTNVSATILENDFPLYEEPIEGSAVGIHRWVSEYTVLYAESIPSVST
jgi:hypothetical protein